MARDKWKVGDRITMPGNPGRWATVVKVVDRSEVLKIKEKGSSRYMLHVIWDHDPEKTVSVSAKSAYRPNELDLNPFWNLK